MKKTMSPLNRSMLLLLAIFALGLGTQARAYDGHHDQNGFRDQSGNYHRYGYHHHHRGYWNQENGITLWINA
jgi:hypothetical protein